MRQGSHVKRPRGRGHGQGQGGGGGSGGGGGGSRNKNVPLRHQTFDSNGPDIRVRGNAFQVFEKYLALARDAGAVGDRIAAENYYQHAEHYYRIINANSDGQPYNPQQNQRDAVEAEQPDLDAEQPEATVMPVHVPGAVAHNAAQSAAADEPEAPTLADNQPG